MAASTITRDTWTNDTGSFSAPNGDGTVLNNSVLQNNIYARIDAMFAGTGAYATLEIGGLFQADGFGTSAFSAGGTGAQVLSVRNTTAGTGNSAVVEVGNNVVAALGTLEAYSSTFTSSTYKQASGVALYSNGAQGSGGLSLASVHPSAHMRFYTSGTEWMRLSASGGFSFNSTTDPGINNFSVNAAFSVPFFGAHAFASSGTGVNQLSVRNSTAGTVNFSSFLVGNDASIQTIGLFALSSTYTTAGDTIADSGLLRAVGAGGLSISTNNAAGVIRFYSGSVVERARFLSSGEFLINRTSGVGTGLLGIGADSASQSALTIISTNVANALNYLVFYNSVGGIAGSIAQTGATTVAYNTTSDARLKVDGGRAQDLSALRQLIIHDFTWAADGKRDRGVFAQEVFSLLPEAVTKGGDEMTLDGSMVARPWQMNYAKLIPHLVTGWQDHEQTIAALKARIVKLEGVPV